MTGCTPNFFSIHKILSNISWQTKGPESTASRQETLDVTQKPGIAMAATATVVALQRKNALSMRAIVIFMKTVSVVLCVPRTLVHCPKILQKLFTSGRRAASSPLENTSMVYNCSRIYIIFMI